MSHPDYLSSETKNTLTGTLFVVATPIGNLADLSLRAQKILQEVAWIAAEDTRVTGQLCRHIGATAQLFSLREHNERHAAERVLQLLQQGIHVAQVSDAGTPAISDPGARLVETIRAAGLPVVAIPGACAATTALSASGIACEHFYFHGFLPAKSSGRKKALSQLTQRQTAFIFYEAPHRILDSLNDMVSVFGENHTAFFAREITKTFETLRLAPLGVLRDWVATDSNQERGEIVVIIAPLAAPENDETNLITPEAAQMMSVLLQELPPKTAAKLTHQLTQIDTRVLYQYAIQHKTPRA